MGPREGARPVTGQLMPFEAASPMIPSGFGGGMHGI